MMSRIGQCRYVSGFWRILCAIPGTGGVLVGLGAGGKIVLEIVGVGELLGAQGLVLFTRKAIKVRSNDR
jgi:hypothetical protein